MAVAVRMVAVADPAARCGRTKRCEANRPDHPSKAPHISKYKRKHALPKPVLHKPPPLAEANSVEHMAKSAMTAKRMRNILLCVCMVRIRK